MTGVDYTEFGFSVLSSRFSVRVLKFEFLSSKFAVPGVLRGFVTSGPGVHRYRSTDDDVHRGDRVSRTKVLHYRYRLEQNPLCAFSGHFSGALRTNLEPRTRTENWEPRTENEVRAVARSAHRAADVVFEDDESRQHSGAGDFR